MTTWMNINKVSTTWGTGAENATIWSDVDKKGVSDRLLQETGDSAYLTFEDGCFILLDSSDIPAINWEPITKN